MDEIKLRPYDGIAIAGFLTLPWLFYTGPGMMAEQSGSAAWIAVLAAYALTLCLFLITAALIRRHGGKDIIGTASAVTGKPAGILYGVALVLYFCLYTGIFVREGAELLKAYGMRLIPVYLVAGLIILAAVAMNFFGGKAIVKSAGFFFLFIVSGVIFIVLLGLNRYNPDHLFPILGNGIPRIAESGRYIMSVFDSVIILALFAPAFADARALRRSGMIALTVSAALAVLFYLCFILMFSAPIASKMIGGFMEMGKSIYYNHFFYRFESILLFFLIFSSVMTASLGLLIAQKSAAITFQVRSPKIIVIICALFISAAALIPANLLDLTNRYFVFIRRYSLILMAGFPFLLFIISSVKRFLKHEQS